MKEEFKLKKEKYNLSNLNPIIKISHYDDDDKHIKTDTFPVTHFLDDESRNIRVIRYS